MNDVLTATVSAVFFFLVCRWVYLYSREKELRFFDSKKTVSTFLKGFYGSLVVLLGADFFIHKHDHICLGNAYEFYAFYGFISCVMLIFIAKGLRHLIKRDETYYDQ